MTITEEMIEAGAMALRDNNAAELELPQAGRWEDAGAEFQEYWRKRARACLTAALAAAEARGAVLAVVPGEKDVSYWHNKDEEEWAEHRGFNACRAAVLAGRVVV
jgi:hypothetical protein